MANRGPRRLPENTSANGVKRTYFQCSGNPAVGHAKNAQTDLGLPTLWHFLNLKRRESVRTSIG